MVSKKMSIHNNLIICIILAIAYQVLKEKVRRLRTGKLGVEDRGLMCALLVFLSVKCVLAFFQKVKAKPTFI